MFGKSGSLGGLRKAMMDAMKCSKTGAVMQSEWQLPGGAYLADG